MVSIQSTTLSHHQDKPKEMTTKIRIEASSTAAQDYHLQWYLKTVSQHRLGHISIKRARSLNIDGIPQPPSKMPKVKCPVCIASKATRHKRPSATITDTSSASGPWQDIYSDLSGKMRISSICGYRYFAVFGCAWSGAKHGEL